MAYEQVLAGQPVGEVHGSAMAALGGEGLSRLNDLPGPTRHAVLLTLIWCGDLRTAERAARALIARATRRGRTAGGSPWCPAAAASRSWTH